MAFVQSLLKTYNHLWYKYSDTDDYECYHDSVFVEYINIDFWKYFIGQTYTYTYSYKFL